MKVKLVSCYSRRELEIELNRFTLNHDVRDIQFSVSGNDSSNRIWCAMIIYKDQGDE